MNSDDQSTTSFPREIRIGLVGLGYWGPNLLRVIAELERVQVAWICDLDAERLERFGRRYPQAQTTSSVEDVTGDPDVEAIIIATPVGTHYDLASRSLRAGKHTFVEKPLAPSLIQAEQLVTEARSRHLALMCGHTFIYSPAVRAVKTMITTGELGEVYFLTSSRVNLGLHQRDASVVWDLGPHDFSILLYWLEEMPTAVRTVGRDSIVPGVPDVAFITLTFASGIVANIELSWLAPSKLRRSLVVGKKKMVVYEDGHAEPVRVFDHGVVFEDPESFGEYHLSYRTGDIVSPKMEAYEPLSAELGDFISAVREQRSLGWHSALAVNVVALTEAADLSLRQGGGEVAVRPASEGQPADSEPFAKLRARRRQLGRLTAGAR